MLKISTLLTTIALAIFSYASPANLARGEPSQVIQLRQRRSLTRPDGVFDYDKALIQSITTKNKHRQNLMNLQKNVGFPEDFEIKPLAVVPPAVKARLNKRSYDEPLTDEEDDLEWAGYIKVGIPGQKFLIDFDTGSSDLWEPSSSCQDPSCEQKNKYNASASKTSEKEDGNFTILYGDGSTVSGPIYKDTVSVAGVKVTDQYFSPVTSLSDSFSNAPPDGILGMAYPAISNLQQDPFFVTAYKQHAVASNRFAFYLAQNGSELVLGGEDYTRYSGSFEYHKINTATGFWQIPGAKALANGKTVVSDFQTIVDSGTTIMYGPPGIVATVWAAVGGKLLDETEGFYSFPCDKVPKIAFSWGGKDWQISAANLNLGRAPNSTSECVGSLAGQDIGFGNTTWLLGDSFMKNVYTSFDFGQDAVGFATLRE